MAKAKFFLGAWVVAASVVAGAVFYVVALKEPIISANVKKQLKDDAVAVGEISGWTRSFAEKNQTLYPATEFTLDINIGDKKEEPFYAINLSSISISDIAGIEKKLADMGLLYVSEFDGSKYSILILFEDKNAMTASFNALKEAYPSVKQGTLPTRSTKL